MMVKPCIANRGLGYDVHVIVKCLQNETDKKSMRDESKRWQSLQRKTQIRLIGLVFTVGMLLKDREVLADLKTLTRSQTAWY
jgi:hypothetical protein